MNGALVMDLLVEFTYNTATSLSGYMLGTKVLGLPEPAAILLAGLAGFIGLANHWRALRKPALGALLLMTAGCAGPFGLAGSPDQIHELAKVKDANVTCIIANTPYGKGSALFLNLDKGVIGSGTVSIDDACKTTITNAPK